MDNIGIGSGSTARVGVVTGIIAKIEVLTILLIV